MHKAIRAIAQSTAILGGLVLTALILLTCVSILGRTIATLAHTAFLENVANGFALWLQASGVGSVNGDFELLEAGVAFAIFAFLPICQLHGAHATVDVFTNFLPQRANRYLIAFWECVLAAVIVLITWRLFAGLQSKYAYGETTFLLQFPVWWAYAASFAAACVASLVSVYCAAMRIWSALTGRGAMTAIGETAK
ncbi:MAG: TRAP transporter small permease subunit [Shimia sp.]|uniref:TRAP transporter small permease n=1 Tax=Shimia sp. TaxID=1954381 RepID=UPI001B199899|nr:TRAP transporter small permease subunit [Shimia sp.]MBO6897202.1 TRAP transporter small permease subunit [Shimia sp.]